MTPKKENLLTSGDAKPPVEEAVVAALVAPTSHNLPPKPVGNADGFCIYLGPSIRGVIQSGTVYSMGKKRVLVSIASAVAAYPLIATLLVSGETIAQDRIKVKTPGNLLYVNYKKLASTQNQLIQEEV